MRKRNNISNNKKEWLTAFMAGVLMVLAAVLSYISNL